MTANAQLVEVACNICGSRESELLYESQGFRTVRCKGCGLAYVNPRLGPEALRALYGEEFYTQDEGKAGCNEFSENASTYDKVRFTADLGFIEGRRRSKGKLLDVGCGLGRFVAFARERGWQAEGIDFSDFSSEYGRKKGLPIKSGELAAAGYAPASFDVITMFHVLEHLEDPLGFVAKQVLPLLKPEGLLVIEIPNFGSKGSREEKGNWVWARPKEHLYGFTTDTLRKLLEKAGFSIVDLMEKSAMTFGGQVHDPGQIQSYRALSESRLGEGIKARIRNTPLWALVRGGRDLLLKSMRPFKKVQAGDMEIFCVARKPIA